MSVVQISDPVSALARLPEWQVLLVVLTVSVLVAALIRVLGAVVIRRLTPEIGGQVDDVILRTLHPALYVSAVLLGPYLARDTLALEQRLDVGLEATVLSLLTLTWGYTLFRLGRRVSAELAEEVDRGHSIVPIVQNVWSALIVGVGTYFVLAVWRIDVTPILASAGVVGIVIGFAARDTIANFFGSIALYSDGTYRVGDYIVLESGERGRVEDISIRSTVIRTRDDVRVTIPNSKLNSAVLINESEPEARYRLRTRVGVAYGSDMDQVEAVLLAAAGAVELVLETPSPRVRLREFGDSALAVELLCWVRAPAQRGRATHEVNREIYQRLRAADVEIPVPKRSITVENQPVGVGRQETVSDD
jgi:small-conductance mechanosensitive channel